MKLRRIRELLKTLAVTTAILFSFTIGAPAAAAEAPMPMEGMPHLASPSLLNCLSQHHIAPGTRVMIDVNEREDNEPQPLPYFMQFGSCAIDTTQKSPTDIMRASSYRPPDIVRLTNNIRL